MAKPIDKKAAETLRKFKAVRSEMRNTAKNTPEHEAAKLKMVLLLCSN